MIDWDVIVGSEPDPMRSTFDVLIRVKVPDAVIANLRHGRVQHDMVDYVARRLHEYVDREFSQKRLAPGVKALPAHDDPRRR